MRLGEFYTIPPGDWRFTSQGDVLNAIKRASKWLEEHGSYEGAERHIEEFVRQWALSELITSYGYPEEWLGERITIEEGVKIGSTTVEADIALKNINKRPFFYVEAKTYGCSKKEWDEGKKQLESELSATHTATVGMLTDGKKSKVIRKKIEPNDFEYIPDFDHYDAPTATSSLLVRDLPPEAKPHLTGLKLLSEEYEDVISSIHNTIRDVDGLHDDEALDELCKIIYAKIFDERMTVASEEEKKAFRFQVYGASSPSEAASNIRDLYEEAVQHDIDIYENRIPNYERTRGVFKAKIHLSDPALYRVTEQLQKFSFVDSQIDVKGRAFQRVLSSAIRAGMGQYFTPDPIVDLAVRLIQPRATELILDPFCGSAHFLTRSLNFVMENQSKKLSEHAIHEFKFFHLHGIELSDRMVRIAVTDMMLHDDGHTNIRNTNSLLSFDNYPDILSVEEDGNTNPEVFDVILTNPPFGKLMREEAKGMVGRFTLGGNKKTLPLELLGLERCFQFLKPGGRMAIVMPESFLQIKSHKHARKWVEEIAEIKAVISLPEESFNPYGAIVRTCLCIFRKLDRPDYRSMKVSQLKPLAKENGISGYSKMKKGELITRLITEHDKQNGPIDGKCLLVEMENIGYDATGRKKEGSEVDQVVELFHSEVGWE